MVEHEGSCLCGAVRYAVVGRIGHVSHCHCSMCRKAHGAAFATYGTVRADQHRFTSGSERLREFRSSPSVRRVFCATCGSPMLWCHETAAPGRVSFPLGSLDTPYVAPAHRHIHVASKASWYEIHDPWPQAQAD